MSHTAIASLSSFGLVVTVSSHDFIHEYREGQMGTHECLEMLAHGVIFWRKRFRVLLCPYTTRPNTVLYQLSVLVPSSRVMG